MVIALSITPKQLEWLLGHLGVAGTWRDYWKPGPAEEVVMTWAQRYEIDELVVRIHVLESNLQVDVSDPLAQEVWLRTIVRPAYGEEGAIPGRPIGTHHDELIQRFLPEGSVAASRRRGWFGR